MQPFPHIYSAVAVGHPEGSIPINATAVPTIDTAAPSEFGGPGDRWSPESLLCAAIADCFVLTFRSVARSARLNWQQLQCRVEGKLEKAGVLHFTNFVTYAELNIASPDDVERSKQLLEKAEHECLIANSLRGARTLELVVTVRPNAQ
jgi:organic hydroperoxide reductase OsmC/OhrA